MLITTEQINQQIMGQLNTKYEVIKRVKSIVAEPKGLELIHLELSEDKQKVEFQFDGDDFYFIIGSLLMFTPDVYMESVAGQPYQVEVFKSVSELFEDCTEEQFISILRFVLKHRPNVLECFNEEGRPVQYSYLMKNQVA